jgi:MFS transporter, DHA2 family, multidrug resistance protein
MMTIFQANFFAVAIGAYGLLALIWRISRVVLPPSVELLLVARVGSFVQQAANSGTISTPKDALTYSTFIHSIRRGEFGTAFQQRFITVREQFHSNLIGLRSATG